MPALALTTLANVKVLAKETGSSDTDFDAIVGALITAVSERAQSYIGREFATAARTELYSIGMRTRSIFLRNPAVDTGQTFEIRNDLLRNFTGDAMSDDTYSLDAESGEIYFVSSLLAGPNVLQVIYTGGMAADAATLQATYPDLEFAARRQVLHEFNRRMSPGVKRATSRRGKQSTEGEGELNWLDSTREVLDSFRPTWMGEEGVF